MERILEVLPYALLAGSAVLSLIQPGQTSGDRLVTAGLVALAGAWVLFTYALRPPRWRERTGAMVVYFAGMLALATALAFVAVFATSVVIYTAPGGLPQPTVEAVSGWIFIICLQTVLTGFFSQRSLRITATSDVIAVWIPWSW